MLFPINNRQELGVLEKVASIKNQVEEFRLQDKLVEQISHENIKIVFESVTDIIKNTSENLTKIITEKSINNNEALENLNDKFLEIMNDRGILASYLLSLLSTISDTENTCQFNLVKFSNSNRVNDLLIHNRQPVTFYNNLFTFRDTREEFELKGDLLKMLTHKNYNVDLASLSDKKMYDFAERDQF